jgi:hypothetical protein
MLEIKPEILDIILLDKKYKNLEKGIDKLIVKVYDYYKELTASKELPTMYFHLLNEELEKINTLFPKYDENLILTILQIFIVVDEMNIICKNIENNRSKNYDLKLMEHDINNTEKQINLLKTKLEHATTLNNDNDIFKFNFAIDIYKDFKKNKTNALAKYKIFFEGAFFSLYADSSIKEKLDSFSKLQGLKSNKQLEEKVLKNIDYFYDIYCLINGYLLSSKKIHKSSALKIFNIVNDNLKLSKTNLIGKVLYLFEKLGIDNINLDLKKAHNIRKISVYHNYTIYDYSSNTKDTNLYLTINEMLYKIMNGAMEELKKHNFNNPNEEIKKYFYLCALEVFTDNYNKLKYIL